VKTELFDFHLPSQQVAQSPLPERDAAKLLVLDRASRTWRDSCIRQLPEWLNPGDLLIFNDTRVIPARLRATRDKTGGKIEFLLVPTAYPTPGSASSPMQRGLGSEVKTPATTAALVRRALTRSGGKLALGESFTLAEGLKATLAERHGPAGDDIAFRCSAGEFDAFVQKHGEVPLPPYIHRPAGPSSDADRERYQTVFAQAPGAVAAPTAGLHFTPRLLEASKERGIRNARVTLHVGPGTFKSVKAEEVEAHTVDPEPYTIPAETIAAIRATKAAGRRVIAVGTASLRSLESSADAVLSGSVETIAYRTTNLFVYPPGQFRVVDALLSNFHVPRSSLLMLVAAFATPGSLEGIDFVKRAYLHAIESGYRFYSYGDACLYL
jgi:S-adenosylmethionine:tRNA ribosyltransferase-isomerase